jgi:hypothetical protein
VKARRRQNFVALVIYGVAALLALVVPVVAILLFSAVSLAYVAPTFLDTRKDEEGPAAPR